MNFFCNSHYRIIAGYAKHISQIFLISLFFIIASCSSSHEEEVNELLASVPAQAETVSVVNLSTLIRQLDGKVKDGNITDMGKLSDLINKWHLTKMNPIFSGESGIEWSTAVCFISAGQTVVTGYLVSQENFRNAVDKHLPGDWEMSSDKKISFKDGIACRDNRFWIGENLSLQLIESFLSLSDIESFKSNEYAPELSKSKDALTILGSIDRLLASSGMKFGQQTTIRMALGMLFNNPTYIVGSANYDDSSLELEMDVLDNNLKRSHCEIATSNIDVNTVASLKGNANFIAAVAVSEELTGQIKKFASSIGGALPMGYDAVISPLDGTIAFATDNILNDDYDGIPSGFRAIVTTNGKENAQLAQLLQSYATLEIEGKVFNLSKGDYGKGSLELKEIADEFKNAWVGIAMTPLPSQNKSFKRMVLTIIPSNGSLTLKSKISF